MHRESMSSDNFKAREIGLRVQKKILGRLSGKNSIKIFIDGRAANLLDNIYKLFKYSSGNKKEAEKLIKYVIKTTVKIGILYKGGHFNEQEVNQATRLKSCFHKVSMTIVSFYELDYSYDSAYMIKILNEFQTLLKQLVKNHLTEKSLNRINILFQFCTKQAFLDSVFKKDFEHRDIVGNIVSDLNKILEEEGITV